MNRRLLVRGARQLVTLRGPGAPRRGAALRELAIIPDGSLLIEDGTIRAVGPTRRIENLAGARDAEEIDATARVVVPGFVDCHTHLISGPPRLDEYERRLGGASEAEIEAQGGGVRAGAAALRALPSSRLRHQARLALAAFLRHGATTLEGRTGYGRDETGEMKLLRAMASFEHTPAEIVPTFLAAHAIPAAFGGRVEDYLAWLTASLLPKIARRKLARFAALGCAAAGFTQEQARRYLEAARAAGLRLKIETFRRGRDGLLGLGVELGAASVEHLNAAIHTENTFDRPGPFPVQSRLQFAVICHPMFAETGYVHHFALVHENGGTVNTPGYQSGEQQSPESSTHGSSPR